MRRAVLIVALVSFILHSGAAAPRKPVPRLTGQEFVERYFNSVNIPASQQSAKMLVERELALGYMAGAADAAQGHAWCDKGRVKTIEIDSGLAHEMRKLPAQALGRDAASLIIDLLKKRFPCT